MSKERKQGNGLFRGKSIKMLRDSQLKEFSLHPQMTIHQTYPKRTLHDSSSQLGTEVGSRHAASPALSNCRWSLSAGPCSPRL